VHSSLRFTELHIEVSNTNLTVDTFVYELFKLLHSMTRIPLTHLQEYLNLNDESAGFNYS
jgi:hypothetical protein